MPFPSKRQSRARDVEVRPITLRRIRVYDAICAHKRQENFERYARMKGQKLIGRAREGREVNSEICRSCSTSLNETFCITFVMGSKISPMEREFVLRPLGIIHEQLYCFSKAF